jgi:hypothetical protein
MKLIIHFLLLTLIAATANAAELLPRVDNDRLGASLANLSFSVAVTNDFASGLENRILFRVSVRSQARRISQANMSVIVKYDLWDERFILKRSRAGAEILTKDFRSGDDLIAYLARLDFGGLFVRTSLPENEELVLEADILINPVDREKFEQLSKWVAANSAPRGIGGSGPDSATLTSRPNDLFNTIFEQYLRGADIAAPWKMTVTSKTFTIRQLQKESPNP